jgi:hypothetical protein
MKTFKAHPSWLGEIMTNGRGKDSLGATCLTRLQKWYKEQLYDRKKDLTLDTLSRGNVLEDSAIEFACRELGFGIVVKNEDQLDNDYLIGTPDIILKDAVLDVKCSEDEQTFPLLDTEPPKNYWWQLQGYMALTGKSKGILAYCLMDAPDFFVKGKVRTKVYQMLNEGVDSDYDTLYDEVYPEMKARYTWSDLDVKLRLKTFIIERDDSAIAAIEQRVLECRKIVEGYAK